MTGLAFALFYTVLGLPIARYSDRPTTDRGRLIAVALAVWSAMTALCGFAQNFVQLLLARVGVGVGVAVAGGGSVALGEERGVAVKVAGAAGHASGVPSAGSTRAAGCGESTRR